MQDDGHNHNKMFNQHDISKNPIFIPRKQTILRRPVYENLNPDHPDSVQSGMKVEHSTFGIGKVLRIEGVPPNRKASIFFQEIGEEKQLLLKFAKLRIVTCDK